MAEGARVAVTGSSAESVERAREALGAGALVLQADAGDVADQQALAKSIGEAFGSLDVGVRQRRRGAAEAGRAVGRRRLRPLFAIN